MKDMKGVTVGYVACKGQLIGVFTLSDSCRTGSDEAIRELRSLGIKSVMLTGDSSAAASYAQNQVRKEKHMAVLVLCTFIIPIQYGSLIILRLVFCLLAAWEHT